MHNEYFIQKSRNVRTRTLTRGQVNVYAARDLLWSLCPIFREIAANYAVEAAVDRIIRHRTNANRYRRHGRNHHIRGVV